MKPSYLTFLILLLLAVCIIPSVYALPTTGAAAGKNTSTVVFSGTGATCPCYIKYGTVRENYGWQTQNQTNASSTIYIWERGTPLMSCTTFFYKMCDVTGCSATEKGVTLTQVTQAPETSYGLVGYTISRSHFDLLTVSASVIEPTKWTSNTFELTFGILLFFVFTGLWLRQRETVIPILMGMIGSGMLIYSSATSVGVSPEYIIISSGLVALALTGIIMGWFKR